MVFDCNKDNSLKSINCRPKVTTKLRNKAPSEGATMGIKCFLAGQKIFTVRLEKFRKTAEKVRFIK